MTFKTFYSTFHDVESIKIERNSNGVYHWIDVFLYSTDSQVRHTAHLATGKEGLEVHDWSFVPPTVEMPQVGSYWIHEESGECYMVSALANVDLMRDPKPEETNKFPPTIVYTHASGRIYSRVAHEWIKRFREASAEEWMQACASLYPDQLPTNVEQPSGESHGPDQDSQSPSPDRDA